MIRSDEASQVRVREPEETDKPAKKMSPGAAEKSESKPREKDDEDTADETTQAADDKTASDNTAGQTDGQANTAQTDAKVAEALAAELPIATTGETNAAAEGLGQKVATDTVLPQQAALQATQAVAETRTKTLRPRLLRPIPMRRSHSGRISGGANGQGGCEWRISSIPSVHEYRGSDAANNDRSLG